MPEAPNPQLGSLHRVRIRYTKVGRVRYVSARDLGTVWERAIRRAGLPIAYSEGFHPHAKVSFPDALPVGVESTGEYAELTFAGRVVSADELALLSAALPVGMDILTFAVVPDGASKLARSLTATMWELVIPAPSGAGTQWLQTAVEQTKEARDSMMQAETLPVVHRRPKGDKTVDLRPVLKALEPYASLGPHGPQLHIRSTVDNYSVFVRPDDFAQALHAQPALADNPLPKPTRATRVAQGAIVDGGLTEALTDEFIPLESTELAEVA